MNATRRYHLIPAGGAGLSATNYDDTATAHDDLNRVKRTTDRAGKHTFYTYGVHDAGGGVYYAEHRVYPHNKDSGPVQVTWMDDEGLTVRSWEGASAAAWSEASPPTGAEALTEVSRTSYVYDWRDRTERVRQYHDLPATLADEGTLNTNYYESQSVYDNLDRTVRSIDPLGTVTASVYDALGRVKSSWMGVDAGGATRLDPSNAGGNGMKKVADTFYDTAKDGSGALLPYATRSRSLKPQNGTNSFFHVDHEPFDRTTDAAVTDRRRITRTKPEVGPWHKAYSNRAGMTDESLSLQNGSDTHILDQSSSLYDGGDRLTQSRFHEDDGAGALTGKFTQTLYFYDSVSRQVKVATPAGGFTKTQYDDAQRTVRTVVAAAEGADSSPDGFANDTVLMESVPTYDAADNVIASATYEREPDAAVEGLLSASPASARAGFAFSWYDDAHRMTHSADYGTHSADGHSGATPARPATPPASSDTVLVSITAYDPAGRVVSTTDPKGLVTQRHFDDLHRATHTIENYKAGATHWDLEPSDPKARNSDTNRVTATTYNALSQPLTRVAVDPNHDCDLADNQTTAYIYADQLTDKGAPVPNNALLRAVIYPDSDDALASQALSNGTDSTFDRVEFTYLADGSLDTRKDQRGTVITHSYYDDGLRKAQKVTALGGETDGGVRSITYAYDDHRRLTKLTSHGNLTDDPDDVADVENQVVHAYDGMNQLASEKQDHDGVVDGNTPQVAYAFDTTAVGNLYSLDYRPTSITYPNGRVVHTYDELHRPRLRLHPRRQRRQRHPQPTILRRLTPRREGLPHPQGPAAPLRLRLRRIHRLRPLHPRHPPAVGPLPRLGG